MKGADVAMASIVQYNDWLEEEVSLSNGCFVEFLCIAFWQLQPRR